VECREHRFLGDGDQAVAELGDTWAGVQRFQHGVQHAQLGERGVPDQPAATAKSWRTNASVTCSMASTSAAPNPGAGPTTPWHIVVARREYSAIFTASLVDRVSVPMCDRKRSGRAACLPPVRPDLPQTDGTVIDELIA
jgi:hypothetical protein